MANMVYPTLFIFSTISLACAIADLAPIPRGELVRTTDKSAPDPTAQYCVTMPFRYLIVSDHQMTKTLRKIEIFMDDAAFSEENLKTLFRYLSDKNPDPNSSSNNLMVKVNTDWKQLHFPTDCPPSGTSGGNSGRDAYDHHWALFYRRGDQEFFTYNPIKKEWKNADVIMKGDEIFRNGAWQNPN